MSKIKLSSEDVKATLAQVGPALRALSEENQSLREKVASYQKRERVEKIAQTMQEKGLNPDTTFQQKVAALMQRTDLSVIESAIDMSAPQIKLAEVSDTPGNPSDARSAFEIGLMT
jgi:ABC-type antimicrobial peptide transport system ATPase subunit